MFFIASLFQLPPVSERFHGNYRRPQQSGSHRSDHKVTPADGLHLQPASSRSGNTCLPQRPEFWSFAVYWLLRVTHVSCFSLDSHVFPPSVPSAFVLTVSGSTRCFSNALIISTQHLLCGPTQNHTLLLLVILGILVLLVIYCPVIVFQHLRGHGDSLLTKLI